MGTEGRPPASAGPATLWWLDLVRGLAILWIFTSHAVERVFGFPFIANPSPEWPSLAARVVQLAPIRGHGAWDFPLNLLRTIGWSGDQGVQLFLIASGFGLAWGPLRRAGSGAVPALAVGDFYRRRLLRIYPPWWGAHALFGLAALLIGWGFAPASAEFWLSAAGFRATPHMMYAFTASWWYVGLILQLYAVFPLLWWALRRWGPGRLLAATCALGFALRLGGLLTFHDGLDAWSRGGIFLTRLPEFAFGMALAAWLAREPARADARVRSPQALFAAVVAYLAGSLLSLTLPGMAIAPFLLGASMFAILYAVFALGEWQGGLGRALAWLGRRSYALYLVHHPFVTRLVPRGPGHGRRAILGTLLAAALTLVVGLLLEAAVARVSAWLGERRRRAGLAGAGAALAGAAAAVVALAVGAELISRRIEPRERDGWGERASLAPDPALGWRLAPSRATRLRWTGYDYVVRSNALGFPGPDRPEPKPPGTIRVLVTGDAFTSAEGVDTDEAWPRRLEALLADRTGRRVEVLNFAMTGYGPSQYARVVRTFAPRFRPDLVLVEFFVNDFEDAATPDSAFVASIGFGHPDPDGLRSVLSLANLRALRVAWGDALGERLRGRPRAEGTFLGGFTWLERERLADPAARAAVAADLEAMRGESGRIQAPMLIALAPAAAQVCRPADVNYWPRGVDPADTTRFDREGPQRLARSLAAPLGIPCLDLRAALAGAHGTYQRRNMHWTAAGHRAVAAWLADTLARGPWLAGALARTPAGGNGRAREGGISQGAAPGAPFSDAR